MALIFTTGNEGVMKKLRAISAAVPLLAMTIMPAKADLNGSIVALSLYDKNCAPLDQKTKRMVDGMMGYMKEPDRTQYSDFFTQEIEHQRDAFCQDVKAEVLH